MSTSTILAILAAFILGVSKSGVKGMGIVIVTLMALAFGAKASTGILLPMLIFADTMAVIYYRRAVRWDILLRFLPWMVIGILLAVWLGKDLPEDTFKQWMSIIIILSVINMYVFEKRDISHIAYGKPFAIVCGVAAGFTTMIGNLAGAFSNLYFLALRIPKKAFIGTAAWMFFFINIFKLPFHIWSWKTIDTVSIWQSAQLFIFVAVGFAVGIRIVEKINEQAFRKFILIMTAIGALALFFR